jgi:hypothetical protein
LKNKSSNSMKDKTNMSMSRQYHRQEMVEFLIQQTFVVLLYKEGNKTKQNKTKWIKTERKRKLSKKNQKTFQNMRLRKRIVN